MLAGILTKKKNGHKKKDPWNKLWWCHEGTSRRCDQDNRGLGRGRALFFPPSFRTEVTLREGKGIQGGGEGAAHLLKRKPPTPTPPPPGSTWTRQGLALSVFKKKKKKKVWAFRSTTQDMGHPDCKRSKEKQRKKKQQNLRSLPNSNKYNHVLLSQHCATTRGHRFSTRQPSSYSQSNRTRVGQELGELVAYNLRSPTLPSADTRGGVGQNGGCWKISPTLALCYVMLWKVTSGARPHREKRLFDIPSHTIGLCCNLTITSHGWNVSTWSHRSGGGGFAGLWASFFLFSFFPYPFSDPLTPQLLLSCEFQHTIFTSTLRKIPPLAAAGLKLLFFCLF